MNVCTFCASEVPLFRPHTTVKAIIILEIFLVVELLQSPLGTVDAKSPDPQRMILTQTFINFL